MLLSSVPRTTDDEDAAAVRAVVAGDADAFGVLVTRHHAAMLRVVTGIVVDRHLADDVAQEVWWLVYRKLDRFQFRARFSTWLYRVAVREAGSARNRVRSYLARHAVASERVESAEAPPERVADGEDVVRMLAWLPLSERKAFALHVEGLTYDEIAGALGWPAGTVATRIKRAREKLASWMRDARPLARRAESPAPRPRGSATARETPR